jgi:hypothetical protein
MESVTTCSWSLNDTEHTGVTAADTIKYIYVYKTENDSVENTIAGVGVRINELRIRKGL